MGTEKRTKRSWPGGYVIRDARGRDAHYIRKQLDGRRYDVSTGGHSMRAAMKQLEHFEADPAGYRPRGPLQREPLFLDEELAAEFLAYCRDKKHNSPAWRAKQRGYIAWWAERLSDVDLRRATLVDHILPSLEGQKAQAHRIATLKALYSFLRNEKHLLLAAEDPTFGTLRVPQSEPEQWRQVKTIPKEHYLLAREHLTQTWRDPMDVQAGTGWHATEVRRFAEAGSIKPYPREGVPGVAGVLVCPQTKGEEMLRTAVSAEVLGPAE